MKNSSFGFTIPTSCLDPKFTTNYPLTPERGQKTTRKPLGKLNKKYGFPAIGDNF